MGFLAASVFALWLISGIWSAQAVTFQPLNMSVKAFDDQYEGCTENMTEIIQSLLAEEKNADQEFRSTWDDAENRWKTNKPSVSSGFRDEYGIALMAYTNKDKPLYSQFNAAVRDYKGRETFRYHSLHFLLTQAVKLLAPYREKSTTLYRGMSTRFQQTKWEKVRFGQFSSSSESEEKALGFGNDTFFTFTSDFGASLKKYSYFPEEEEILIPVDEVFEVASFEKEGDKGRFVLKATKGRCHFYNCDYIKKGGKSRKCVYSGGTRAISSSAVVVFLLCQIVIFS